MIRKSPGRLNVLLLAFGLPILILPNLFACARDGSSTDAGPGVLGEEDVAGPVGEATPARASDPVFQRASPSAPGSESPDSDYPPSNVEANRGGPRYRALLVGINDYDYPVDSRSKSRRARKEWMDLEGAVNDVHAVREMLSTRFGFPAEGIELLVDAEASREAILHRLDAFLVEPARPGDRVLFYFSGHGSLLKSGSDAEYDLLDETLVPHDSKLGAPDIRDKELRRRFNRILDQGALLTVVLDSCHSGSGARGYPIDGRPKGLEPMWAIDPPEDAPPLGPAPDRRGALVWSATQDDRRAYETEDEGGKAHGAFTLAWLRAILDSDPNESANYLFRRTRGRLLAEPRYQEPVLAGTPAVRSAPLFGGAAARESRTVVAVERVRADGRIELQGGWIHGIGAGSRLRRHGDDADAPPIYEVTRVLEWGRSIAVALDLFSSARESASGSEGESRGIASSVSSGTLLEVTNWVAPGGQPLKVWIPSHDHPESLAAFARRIADGARSLGWRWVEDPTVDTPTHVLRWQQEWQWLGPDRAPIPLGETPSAEAMLVRLQEGKGSLFVHLPAPRARVAELGFGAGTDLDAVEPVEVPGQHHYTLAGRLHRGRVEYAWLRAGRISERRVDEEAAFLPVRTPWTSWEGASEPEMRAMAPIFREQNQALGLARIHAWHTLAAPGHERFGYDLSIRDPVDRDPVDGEPLEIGRRYGLALVKRASVSSASIETRRRYVYVFLIDSEGSGVLLYPDPYGDNLENRHPRPGLGAPDEILLEPAALFVAAPPQGTDSYFLLTSAEPIPDPLGVFEFEGVVRGTPRDGMTPLERLLFWTSSSTRGAERIAPEKWSLDRYPIEVIPARP